MIPRPDAATITLRRALVMMMVAIVSVPAAAQVVERHLPPAPAAPVPKIGDVPPPAEVDDRPLGPALSGIVLLDGEDAAVSGGGVQVVGLSPPGEDRLMRSLAGLIGRPLSRKLIADAVAVVARHYRAQDRPFVSITTPPQELTGGVLRLRVVEFVAGRLAVQAASAAEATAVARRVRFPAGEPIDARVLRQDLGWLEHDPLRRAGAIFGPGSQPGTTDLTVNMVAGRSWQAFAGVATSDAPSSGDVRLFAGGVVGDALGRGSLISVQATTSSLNDPRYWSVAARLVEPLGARREMSLLIGHVRGRREAAPFASRAETTEAALEWRTALPPAMLGDLHIGVEAGHQRIAARFGGLPVYDVTATTLAGVVRYSAAVPWGAGMISADIAVHASPGGVGRANRIGRLYFGRSRAGSSTYAYMTADVTLNYPLGSALSWQSRVVVQASAAPLPGLDQVALGGGAYVRGYTLDDGGYDGAAIVRTTLSSRRWSVAPYLFTDWGWGRDYADRRSVSIGAVGLGIGRTLSRRIRLVAEAALPLSKAPRTRAGDPRLIARIDLGF